jgi:hypothetical protein
VSTKPHVRIDPSADTMTTPRKRDQITSSNDKPNRLVSAKSPGPHSHSSSRSFHQIPNENEQTAKPSRLALRYGVFGGWAI